MNHRSASIYTLALVVLTAPMVVAAKHGDPHKVSAPPATPAGSLTIEQLDKLPRLAGGLAALPSNGIPLTPQQEAKIDLGRQLFFDTRLSIGRTISCATCHDPQKGFADARRLGTGFAGKSLRRHTPTVLNAVFNLPQFWDGRAIGLEAQATMPVMAGAEMNMGNEATVVQRLRDAPDYGPAFEAIYGCGPNLKLLGDAIAAYEATLITPGAPFDRYVRGDKHALTQEQKRGLALFIGKASCVQCHSGANFSDDKFHNIGLPPVAGAPADLGRYEVTKHDEDRGAFKTPTLRNVAVTAPYMHDGSFASLEEVVDHYAKGGESLPGKSDLLFELGLTPQEKRDLIAFLKALTGNLPSGAARASLPRPAPVAQTP